MKWEQVDFTSEIFWSLVIQAFLEETICFYSNQNERGGGIAPPWPFSSNGPVTTAAA